MNRIAALVASFTRITRIKVQIAGGVVLVDDDTDRWICREPQFDAALRTTFETLTDDNVSEIYRRLCDECQPPIASIIGTCRGEWRSLVADAHHAGLIDQEEVLRFLGRAQVYTTTGSVRGECGHEHDAMGAARCMARDGDGCARQGGYSDRHIVRVDGTWSADDDAAIADALDKLSIERGYDS